MLNSSRHKSARRTLVFISYRRGDGAGHAGRLYDRLAGHFASGQVFMDVKSIGPGDDFHTSIEAALASCEVLLAVIGAHWLDAANGSARRLDDAEDLVRKELSAALARRARVIPVLVHGASMPREADLPEALAPLSRLNALEVRDTHWDADVAELIKALKHLHRRRGRLVAAVLCAVVLAGVSLLLLTRFAGKPDDAPVAPPVTLRRGGGPNIPPVMQGQEELVIKGLVPDDKQTALLLHHGASPAWDVTVDFDHARIRDDAVRALELEPHWGSVWERVVHNTRAGSSRRDYTRACSTALEVTAVDRVPTELRLSQKQAPPPDREAYREFDMRADRELLVAVRTIPPDGGQSSGRAASVEDDGPGCLKVIQFGDETKKIDGARTAEIVAEEGSNFNVRFTLLGRDDPARPPAPSPNLSVEEFIKPTFRAREVSIVSTDGGTPVFNARSADENKLLRVSELRIGHDRLEVVLEGLAHITEKDGAATSGLDVRTGGKYRLRAGLSIAAAGGVLLVCLWSLPKLS